MTARAAPPRSRPEPAEPRRRAWWHVPVHALLVAGGWAGFAWMWWLVAGQPWDVQRLAWLIVGSIVVFPLATAAWVRHNRAIFRRKGERRAVAAADLRYPRDWHGRIVQADWAALATARHVVVAVEGDRKRYFDAFPCRPSQPRPAFAPPARPRAPDFADTTT